MAQFTAWKATGNASFKNTIRNLDLRAREEIDPHVLTQPSVAVAFYYLRKTSANR